MADLLIGVQTQDVPSIATAGIEGSAINVAGIEIFSERGLDEAVPVRQFSDFQKKYGRYKAKYNGHYVVEGFFRNLLNYAATLYVKRMVPADAAVASKVIQNATPVDKWKFWAGQYGKKDPGAWGNQVQVLVIETSRGNSTIAAAVASGATTVVVDSVAPFELYDFVKLYNTGETMVHTAQITSIDEMTNTLTFSTAVPALTSFVVADFIKIVDRTVKVYFKDASTGIREPKESFSNLNIDARSAFYAPLKINNESTGSMYLMLEDMTVGVTVAELPAVTADDAALCAPLTGGLQGNEALSTTQIAVQHQAFNNVDIRYLSNAEFFSEAVWEDGEEYCLVRGDCKWTGTAALRLGNFSVKEKWANRRRKSRKVYAWTVGTWGKVDDPVGVGSAPLKEIPTIGHVMGYDIFIKSLRGIHKVPASRKNTIQGLRGLVDEVLDRRELTELGNIGFNEITDKGGSYAIRSARSPSKLKDYTWIHALDMTIYFKKTFENAFLDVENEPNKQALLNNIVDSMRRFSQTFYTSSSNGGNEGGYGDGSFTDVVKIVADSSINPQAKLNDGELRVNYYFRIPGVVEKLMIGVGLLFNG